MYYTLDPILCGYQVRIILTIVNGKMEIVDCPEDSLIQKVQKLSIINNPDIQQPFDIRFIPLDKFIKDMFQQQENFFNKRRSKPLSKKTINKLKAYAEYYISFLK